MAHKPIDPRLLGQWTSKTNETERVTVEFASDGSLVYSIHAGGRIQKMLLEFTAQNGIITTDQPSQPRIETTRYRFTDEGKLELEYEGETTTYTRSA